MTALTSTASVGSGTAAGGTAGGRSIDSRKVGVIVVSLYGTVPRGSPSAPSPFGNYVIIVPSMPTTGPVSPPNLLL